MVKPVRTPSHLRVAQLTPFFGSMSSKWFCTNMQLASQSAELNSYGMFQPSGPNFLLSCTTVWRKEMAYTSGMYSAWSL